MRIAADPLINRLLLVAALPLYIESAKERERVYTDHKYGAATVWLQKALDGEIAPQSTKFQKVLKGRLPGKRAAIFHLYNERAIGLSVAKGDDGLWRVATRKAVEKGPGVVAAYPHKSYVPDMLVGQDPVYLTLGEASAPDIANRMCRKGSELYKQALHCAQIAQMHGALRKNRFLLVCLKDQGKIMLAIDGEDVSFHKHLPYASAGAKPRCQFFATAPPDLGCHPTGQFAVLPQSRVHLGDVIDIVPKAERAIRGLLASRVLPMVGVACEGEFYICGLNFDGENTTAVVYSKGRRLPHIPTMDLDKGAVNKALLVALKEVIEDPTPIEDCPTKVHRFYGIASSFGLGLKLNTPLQISDLFESYGLALAYGTPMEWLIERRPDDRGHPMAQMLDEMLGKAWLG